MGAIVELPIRWVASFVAVYEQGHFGSAAQMVHLTTSAISKHVRGLERELGTPLLVRRPGAAVEVTAAGHRFAAAARNLLAAHEAARSAAVRSSTETRTVRLGVLAGVRFTGHQLDYLRAAVALRCPGWKLTLIRVGFTAALDSLLDRVVDVLWTGAAPRHSKVSAVQIGQLTRVGIVGSRRWWDGTRTVDAATFAELPLLYNPAIPSEWMDPFCLHDIRPPRDARLVPIAGDDFRSVVGHVARGTGVAVVVGPLPPATGRGVLTVALDGLPAMATHAAFRAGDRREVVHTVVDAMAELRLGAAQPP